MPPGKKVSDGNGGFIELTLEMAVLCEKIDRQGEDIVEIKRNIEVLSAKMEKKCAEERRDIYVRMDGIGKRIDEVKLDMVRNESSIKEYSFVRSLIIRGLVGLIFMAVTVWISFYLTKSLNN